MRTDGEDEGRLAEADEAPAADCIFYSLSGAVNWGSRRSWRPLPPAAPIAAVAAPAPAPAPGGAAPVATENPQ